MYINEFQISRLSIDWLIDLIYWLIDRLIDWLVDLLHYRLNDRLTIDWLIEIWIAWSIEWSTDWLIDWLIDQLRLSSEVNEEDVIKASAKESAGLEDRQLAEALARFVLQKNL